ncbi:TetR/AcrR family transcriptional regulator [Mycobacterium sp. LTG2003]
MGQPLSGILKPPKRADARRNYEALLVAAAETFSAHGTDAPLDEIARRAGVGNATLYRNFPTRRELIVAVCASEVEALRDHAEQMAGKPAREALIAWLDLFVDHIAANKGLAAALMTGTHEDSALIEASNELIRRTVSKLLDRARSAEAVKPGVDVADLTSLAHALALIAESDGRTQAQRMLRMFFDGAAISPRH